MLERIFRLSEHGTNVRTEVVAGVTTFLTMAYIIVVQPAMLSTAVGDYEAMPFGAVLTATCLAAALGTVLMGLWARYPIGLAPGMGVNAYFAYAAVPAAAAMGYERPWAVALGAVLVAGLVFLAITFTGLREKLLDAVSPSMKNAIAAGIGLFIAFIGLKNAGLIVANPATFVTLNPAIHQPGLVVFFVGLLVAAVLHVRRVKGSILLGILAACVAAVVFKVATPEAMEGFRTTWAVVAPPPDVRPTLFAADLAAAFTWGVIPFVVVFLFIDMFDTMGTLVGVSEQGGFLKEGKLPRAGQAFGSDAVATVAGACLGTSTVTSYIESAAGIEAGGRTGLTALVVAAGFLLALFFSPLIAMLGSYPPITAPALVIVGAMMMANVRKIDWEDTSESIPAFLVLVGMPLTFSIGDGIALGLMAYPAIKLLSGRVREVKPAIGLLALLLVAYFVFVRSAGGE